MALHIITFWAIRTDIPHLNTLLSFPIPPSTFVMTKLGKGKTFLPQKHRSEGNAKASVASDPSGSLSRRSTCTTQGRQPNKFGSYVVHLPGRVSPHCSGREAPQRQLADPPDVNVDNGNAPNEPHNANINIQHSNVNAKEEENAPEEEKGTVGDDGSDRDDVDSSSSDDEDKEEVSEGDAAP